MTRLEFQVTFRGPFAVSTGVAHSGMDTTISTREPLPSTAIKGLLKGQLVALGASRRRIEEIFTSGDHTRWVFGSGDVSVRVNAWARVQVDDGGKAQERQLMVGEQAFAETGTFVITWTGSGEPPAGEVLALRAAARNVTSLGSHRRRGLGWVSIADAQAWTDTDSKALLAWLAPREGDR